MFPERSGSVPVRFTQSGYTVLAPPTHGGLCICLLVVYMSAYVLDSYDTTRGRVVYKSRLRVVSNSKLDFLYPT